MSVPILTQTVLHPDSVPERFILNKTNFENKSEDEIKSSFCLLFFFIFFMCHSYITHIDVFRQSYLSNYLI